MSNAVLDIATKMWKDAGVTPPWQNGGTDVSHAPAQTEGVFQGEGNAASTKSDVYSSTKNPSKKAGFPVYTPYDGGYAVDYDIPHAEVSGDTTGIDSKSNKSTQGNNAETIGNVNDEGNKVVGSFLDRNIFGGLSEAANPGASLS